MINHVAMGKLKNEAKGNNNLRNKVLAMESLLRLLPVISQINSIEAGVNFNPTEAVIDLILIILHTMKWRYLWEKL